MALRLSEAKIESEHGKQLVEWLKGCGYYRGKRVEVAENTEETLSLRLYTARNRYTIDVTLSTGGDEIYMTGFASTRTPRPGEDRTRGNSLSNGWMSKKLFDWMFGSIVFYEALEVAKDIEYITDEAEED